MLKSKIFFLGAAILAVGLLGATPSARADSINLTAGNTALTTAGYTGPYGTVTISAVGASGGTASEFQITVTPASGYVTSDVAILALNFNTANTGAITGANSTGSFSFYSCTYSSGTSCGTTDPFTVDNNGTLSGASTTSIEVDGFGDFNYVLDGPKGFSNPLSTFTIDVYTANAISTTNLLSNLLVDNANGASTAVHVAPSGSTCTTGWAAGNADGATISDPSTATCAPEPSTGGMLAIGLVGAGGFGLIWRRRREELV